MSGFRFFLEFVQSAATPTAGVSVLSAFVSALIALKLKSISKIGKVDLERDFTEPGRLRALAPFSASEVTDLLNQAVAPRLLEVESELSRQNSIPKLARLTSWGLTLG